MDQPRKPSKRTRNRRSPGDRSPHSGGDGRPVPGSRADDSTRKKSFSLEPPVPHEAPKVKRSCEAFIVLNPDYKSCDQEQLKKEIQEHVKNVTAPYKHPRKVEFVQELPKNVSGKIQRHNLRERDWETV